MFVYCENRISARIAIETKTRLHTVRVTKYFPNATFLSECLFGIFFFIYLLKSDSNRCYSFLFCFFFSYASRRSFSLSVGVRRLTISTARLTDSGNYSCMPTNAEGTSAIVHVINGEWTRVFFHTFSRLILYMEFAVVIAFIIFFFSPLLAKHPKWHTVDNFQLNSYWLFFSFFLCPSFSVFLFRLLELSITICYYLTRTFVSPSGRSFVRSVCRSVGRLLVYSFGDACGCFISNSVRFYFWKS